MNLALLQARKEVLQMRASLERLEVTEHIVALRRSATPAAVWQAMWPRLAARLGASEHGVGLALRLLRRHPLASSVVSLIAARKGLPVAGRLAKWAGLAWAGWTTYRSWRAVKDPAPSTRRRRGA